MAESWKYTYTIEHLYIRNVFRFTPNVTEFESELIIIQNRELAIQNHIYQYYRDNFY